eukprot:TRINITY_DN27188_c0_g2_i1.p5 TRINITY_DN27188_c0_g2~~TRINITY_DN27188_c0_g2_i1.p5  ORF type:complete len:103 (+),score=1.73 TRINITY_DN27188_c0_g2_i1:311-619(+)
MKYPINKQINKLISENSLAIKEKKKSHSVNSLQENPIPTLKKTAIEKSQKITQNVNKYNKYQNSSILSETLFDPHIYLKVNQTFFIIIKINTKKFVEHLPKV